MENIKFKPNLFRRIVAFILAMTMCLSLGITYTFAESVESRAGLEWTFDQDTPELVSSDATTATTENDDFKIVYHTQKGFNTPNAYIGGRTGNGVVNTKGLIGENSITYIEYTAKKTGTLKVLPNTASGRFAVNKLNGSEREVIGFFTANDVNNELKLTNENFVLGTVSSDNTYTEVFVKVEAGSEYIMTTGSTRPRIYGFELTPEGGVTPPPVEEDTTEKDTEADTEKDTESATEKDTVATTEKDTEATTEAAPEKPLELGDVNGDGVITADDASTVLQYVLNKVNKVLSKAELAAAEVSGDDVITAMDAAQILNKSIDPSYVFTKNNTPSVDTTEKDTEATTTEVKTEDSTTEPDTTEPGPGPSNNPTLWVLGDSTVCNYTAENVVGYNFRQGWGMRLEDYVDTSKITIKNLARSGRSARDFYVYENGAPYKEYTDGLKAGDYVLIQFGHNDEKDLLKVWNLDNVGDQYDLNTEKGKTDYDKHKADYDSNITNSKEDPKPQTVKITQELIDSTNTQSSNLGKYATVDGNYGKREGGIGGAAGLDWRTKADENGYVAVEKIISVPGTASEDGKVPSFEWYYFNKYIKPAKDAGATVILVTPVTRLQGAPKDTDGDGIKEVADLGQHTNSTWKTTGIKGMNYVAAIKTLADEEELKYIDLTALSQEYWNKVFTDKVNEGSTEAEAYDYARKLLHAYNKGDGKTTDKTHLSKDGAAAAAKLITDNVRERNLPLAQYLKPVAE